MEMHQCRSNSSASNVGGNCEDDETVTVKFNANHDQELFTKAFDIRTMIKDIKAVLIDLLRIDISADEMSIEQGEHILSDDSKLGNLGVAAFGTIELNVKMAARCKLDKNLIYEYMPTLDVITVRIRESKRFRQLVVEIEDQRCQKPWLGGYLHPITRTQYHHAICQTRLPHDETRRTPSKSHSTQTVFTTDRSTSTNSDRSVQVSRYTLDTFAPSRNDQILITTTTTTTTTHSLQQCESFFEQTGRPTSKPNTDETDVETFVGQSYDIQRLQNMRCEIKEWHTAENTKPTNQANREQRSKLKRLTASTVIKFLSRLNECESRIGSTRQKTHLTVMSTAFDEYAKPFVFEGSADQRPITVLTELNQKAETLKEAFARYDDRNSTPPQKLQAIQDMRTLFKQFVFENDHVGKLLNEIVTLLNELADTNEYALTSTRSVRSRVRQRIFHLLEYYVRSTATNSEYENRVAMSVCLRNRRDSSSFQSTFGRMLRCLQNDEIRRFDSFSSICFKLRTVEFAYLVGKIWQNTPLIGSFDDTNRLGLSTTNSRSSSECRMTRWNKHQEWSPWNCVLLAKPQMVAHLNVRNVDSHYDLSILSDVKTKHLQAKIYFDKLL